MKRRLKQECFEELDIAVVVDGDDDIWLTTCPDSDVARILRMQVQPDMLEAVCMTPEQAEAAVRLLKAALESLRGSTV